MMTGKYPGYATQMANHLVKWWKAKFFNGYKPFTVECSDGRISDTEELLRRSAEFETACTTPPPNSEKTSGTSPDQPKTPQHLNVQEISCDVSVEGGNEKSINKRQEFSFTLYDFDGHGKITKDDIAGLVTSIYEVLGSSVEVPHYGSKTIKVKLTVSPDQRNRVSATLINHKSRSSQKSPKSDETRQKKRRMRETNKHYCCRRLDEELQPPQEPEPEQEIVEDSSDICSRLSDNSNSSNEEGECSDDEAKKERRQKRTSRPNHTASNHCKDSRTMDQLESCLRSNRMKKRSSILQRQELLEIIQANMDKNNSNCSFQNRRKRLAHGSLDSSKQCSRNNSKHHSPRHKNLKMTAVPLQYLADMVDPTLCVDFECLQKAGCEYNQLLNAVIYVSGKPEMKSPCLKRQIAKTRDNCTQYQPMQSPISNADTPAKLKKPLRKVNDTETNPGRRNGRKFPHIVLGHTSSPHHIRHRNRQEDQARAMAQVVQWLEQEFASNLPNEEKPKGEEHNYSYCTSGAGVARHEHHHVHEHIHHHYHHYQEAPVLV